jgi:flavin reductase (DIM6/NTAB) family NADH-FMN oxidoreductase RutF
MQRVDIPFDRLVLPVVRSWETQWFVLAAGEFPENWNCMTVAWGGLGVMWSRPIAMVVVRPTRHTYSFMEKQTAFTLSAFPEEHHEMLDYLGRRSGRDGDKVAKTGLTPIASRKVSAPGFDEAGLIMECRKVYFHDFDPAHFLAEYIAPNYPSRDYHRMYFGEILAVSGSSKYCATE